MPPHWTVREWTDFVVRLAKSPVVQRVDVVGEWWMSEWLFLAPWDIPPSLTVAEAERLLAVPPPTASATTPATQPLALPFSPRTAAILGIALLLLALLARR
ncbi:MAG: hypothetical protein QXD60_01015 [Nanopusillaceae archaeon]